MTAPAPRPPGFGARLKAAAGVLFPGFGGNYASGLGTYSGGSSFWSWPYAYPGSRRDWALEAGDLWRNSAVSVALGWICRNIVYAVPEVTRPTQDETGNEVEKAVKNHRLVRQLNRPNDFYTRATLLRAWVLDYCINGEAYFYKARTAGGRVGQLWPYPSYALRPQWRTDGGDYIDHYVYVVNGQRRRYETKDIVRFLFAPDPTNPRIGWTPLKQCLREVVSDNEIATITSTVLQSPVAHGFLSPADEAAAESAGLDDVKIARLRAQMQQRAGGDQRGGLLLFDFPLKWTEMGMTPEKLALDKIARIPEARIFAALGLQAASQGQAVGEGQRSYANLSEMREADAEGCLLPLWFDFADQAGPDLLEEFGNADLETLGWDFSRVRMLTEDTDAVHERARKNYQAGGITRGEYREKIDEVPDKDRDNVFYVPSSGAIVPATAEAMQARDDMATNPPQAPPESSGDVAAQNGRNGKEPPVPAGVSQKAYATKEGAITWVTINGAHVPIGADGKPDFGGGSAASGSRPGMHAATDAERKALKVPPAWKDVHIANDASAALQVVGTSINKRGKVKDQYRYSAAHDEAQAAAKFARGRAFDKELPHLSARITADMHGSGADRDSAAVLNLQKAAGFRIGSDADTGAAVQAFGASTLTAGHARVEGDTVHFDFIGKEGVRQEHSIHDAVLAKDIAARTKGGGRLFNTTDNKVRSYLKKIDGDYKPHDFRTWYGTAAAKAAVGSMPAPKSEAEFNKARNAVAVAVSKRLGNKPKQALESYIDPHVFQAWKAPLGIKAMTTKPDEEAGGPELSFSVQELEEASRDFYETTSFDEEPADFMKQTQEQVEALDE